MEPPSSTKTPPGPTTDDYGDGPYFDLEFFIDSDQENGLSSSGTCYNRLSRDDRLNFRDKLPPLFKPAAKLRVLMLRLSPSRPRQHQKKVEPEEVRVFSLLSRDGGGVRSDAVSGEKKRVAKNVIHKYLSKIKPLYFLVSRRYGQLTPGGNKECAGHVANIRKMLRKSRSASSTVAPAVPSPPLPVIEEDGIQSAIAHCKRSFDSDKGLECVLFRSRSDPGGERSGEPN